MKRNISTALLALAFGLILASSAGATNDHLVFAAKAAEGDVDNAACRSHGGRQINGNHRNVVIRMGRLDAKVSNVIHYDDRPYVTYRIAVSSLFGTNYEIGLCHF